MIRGGKIEDAKTMIGFYFSGRRGVHRGGAEGKVHRQTQKSRRTLIAESAKFSPRGARSYRVSAVNVLIPGRRLAHHGEALARRFIRHELKEAAHEGTPSAD